MIRRVLLGACIGGTVLLGELWAVDLAARAVRDFAADGTPADAAAAVRRWGFVSVAAGTLVLGLAAIAAVTLYERHLAAAARRERERAEERARAAMRSRSAIVLGLARLAESRHDDTGRHLDRVRQYVRILAEQLVGLHPELTPELVETIVETSVLHDIGKVGIPDEVLLHPGALSDVQREAIQRHTTIGGDTLLAMKRRWGDDPFLVTACEIVFAHHERYDGTGYPFGLEGEDIPIAARIVAVADVYDAVRNPRVYKPAEPHERARAVIVEGSGSHFDPVVVEAFLRAEDAFRAVAEIEADEQPGFW